MATTMVTLLISGVVLASLCLALWIVHDFRAWKALGEGGLPHTPRGWLRMTRLRLVKSRATLTTGSLDPRRGSADDHVYLGPVIRRAGPRPRIAPHPIPHRQLSQFTGTEMLNRLHSVFDDAVTSSPEVIRYQRSYFERHSDAVTLCHPQCGHVYALSTKGEVGHIHPSDGSMHMIMSPSDTATAIVGGWGELHSLAGRLELPITYMFVYAPRDETELHVVEQLLDAAIAHMSERRRTGRPAIAPGEYPAVDQTMLSGIDSPDALQLHSAPPLSPLTEVRKQTS